MFSTKKDKSYGDNRYEYLFIFPITLFQKKNRKTPDYANHVASYTSPYTYVNTA